MFVQTSAMSVSRSERIRSRARGRLQGHVSLQGLVQAWNFNQHEAHAVFSLAAAEDPACSRCWWGVAYALGPGANRCVKDVAVRR